MIYKTDLILSETGSGVSGSKDNHISNPNYTFNLNPKNPVSAKRSGFFIELIT